MKHAGWGLALFAGVVLAEEPPTAGAEAKESSVVEVIRGEELEGRAPPAGAAPKKVTPKEAISVDEAVDMPRDI